MHERLKPLSTKDAEAVSLKLYGLEARAKSLPGYADWNFLLETDSGEKHVLKVSPGAEEKEVFDFQNKAMEYLAAKSEASFCPRVCLTLRGEQIGTAEARDSTHHSVRLLTYLPGTFLAQAEPHTPELLRSVGRLLAAVDRGLEGFSHPAMHRNLVWDLKNGPAIKPYIDAIEKPENKSLVEMLLRRFVTCATPFFPLLRRSVIHNDGNDYNILVRKGEDGKEEAAGIIDFGDMVHTFTVCEPAIAAAYAALGKPDPLEAAAFVVEGYHAHYPLTEKEIEILFHLICARLCTSVSLSAYEKKRNPENEYIPVSEKQAWDVLKKIAGVDPRTARQTFWDACGLSPCTSRGTAFRESELSNDEILKGRKDHFGESLSLHYRNPLQIVRGSMQYLFDEMGRAYLDGVNNVPHVGHCHPRVVRAEQKQTALLNTNTRYLHELRVRYAKRLCATFPDPLSVCFFVCSGSEANDLTLRLAQTYTGHTDVIVVEGAYHGNLSSCIDISPYKFDGPGGGGAPAHVLKVPIPDSYRGLYRSGDPDSGEKYAAHLREAIAHAHQQKRSVAAFICESMLGCGGQIVLPKNYLKESHSHVKDAGGVLIADEVQVGFGRVGTHFWAFQIQDVVPHIVTLGKPMGNGHPMAAVITTQEIADAFHTGMEYFNTYGGNPVSCAVGMAVLDVLEEERLQENALIVGNHLRAGLKELAEKHPLIGDVRGAGLFVGVELVSGRDTLEPAATEAREVMERMKEEGVLIGIDGPYENVLKIKPPLVFSKANADFLVTALDRVLKGL